MKRFVSCLLCVLLLGMMLGACDSREAAETTPAPSLETGRIISGGEESPHPTAHFADYREFFHGTEPVEIYGGSEDHEEITAYLQEVRSDPDSVLVPHQNGSPVVLRAEEGFSGIVVMDRELYNFLWTWFYTNLEGEPVTIRLSELSEENAALASGKTASEFVAAIAPGAPNVNNYQENPNYVDIFTRDAVIDGVSRSILVSRTTDGRGRCLFVLNGHLVVIAAPMDVISDEWLARFSLAPYSE